VVLDANYTSDGMPYDHGNFTWTDANIPVDQIEWLEHTLGNLESPVLVFCHQLLDGSGDVYVNNAGAVRSVLEQADNVRAVFHGHNHPGQYNEINGIHYYTLKAMVEGSGIENNSYAVVEVDDKQQVFITGYRTALSRQWN
jgi:alkaline phosphatase